MRRISGSDIHNSLSEKFTAVSGRLARLDRLAGLGAVLLVLRKYRGRRS
jgi:hypothetical protein